MAKTKAPVIDAVDLLIIGSSTGAVTAALAAREKKARVFVVSERPYFGDESAGSLELESAEPQTDPLLLALRQEEGERPTPGAFKHGLEKALLSEKIPFLFFARPVALLRDEAGAIAGLVIAYRTALYAITAKVILDMTRHGLVGMLAGAEKPLPVSKTASLMVLANEAATAAESIPDAEPVGARWQVGNTQLQAHRITKALPPCTPSVAGLAAVEHRFRSTLVHPSMVYSADTTLFSHPGVANGSDDPLSLPEPAFRHDERLFIADNNLPLSEAGFRRLDTVETQATLGRKLGAWAADEGYRQEEVRPLAAHGYQNSEDDFRFAESFYRQAIDTLDFSFPTVPLLGACDVLVAGGGTAGACAGIAAARAGAKTIVLETQRGLGGVGTLGTIASYWFGNKVGFTREIDEALYAIDPTCGGSGKRARWNPELKMNWYHRTLTEAGETGGEAWLGSFAFGVRMEGDRITGVLVSTPFGSGLLETGCVIDATGNADLAAAAGAPCRVIDANHAATQGAGLSPRHPGDHYINSDFTFIDDSDPAGVTHSFVHARAKFVDAFDTIPFINTRERRQIIGEVELSPLDFLAKRRFPDTINIARSNFDTHGFTVHPVFMVVPPDHKPLDAAVPLRCLLPQGVKGLLVTGLGMSAHRDALPVIRMQADVQNQGYAAGVAAAMAALLGGDFKAIPVSKLQEHLVQIGALDREVLEWSDDFPLPSDAIRQTADQTPIGLFQTAILFAHPEQSIPALSQILATTSDPCQREEAALILGLLGSRTAAPALVEIINSRGWDAGWNYRGMGQFGMSCSRMDALIIALGRTGNPLGIDAVVKKIDLLGADAEFSHCRAVAIAAAAFNTPRLAEALARLLSQPTLRGHSIPCTATAVETANDDMEETASRNLSLRELYLAKGLYLSGDLQGLGNAILQRYTADLRGPYALHARAILQANDLEALRQNGA